MTKYLLESLENGSHGIIPNEGLNYFVGQKRITVYKDGKKVLDKEIDIDPDGNISKYNIVCDGDKEIELEPVKGVEEFNVANVLPQVTPEETVLNKNNMIGTTDVKEYSSGKVSIDDNISFLKNYIADCKAKIDSLKTSKVTGTDLKIQTLKARLQDAESKLKAYNVGLIAASDNSIEIDGEPVTEFTTDECEEITITDEDLMTEAVSETALAVLFGGTMVATFAAGIAVIIKDIKDTKDSINWYADQNNVKPRFEDLKKKTYKVKFNSKDHNFDLTTKEKKWWNYLDQYNAADIYFYNDKRAFGVIYGCHERDITYNGDYTLYRIRIRVVIYNAEFKKHIEYYTAKAMEKHGVVSADINDWIVGIKQDYKEWKKDQKKNKKDSKIVPNSIKESEFDFINDLNTVLETCDNILAKITYVEEATKKKVLSEKQCDVDDTILMESADYTIEKADKDSPKVYKSDIKKIEELAEERADLNKTLKKETDKLKKNDIKKKLIKNEKEFRTAIKNFSSNQKEKIKKFFKKIASGEPADTQLINSLFQQQMLRDQETSRLAMDNAMRAHQTAMDMHNQAVMNNMNMQMMGMM